MRACNLHKYVSPPTEDILIKNVDPVLLEEQRLRLGDLLFTINNNATPNEEEKSALIGVINMLDSWSDERERNQNYS